MPVCWVILLVCYERSGNMEFMLKVTVDEETMRKVYEEVDRRDTSHLTVGEMLEDILATMEDDGLVFDVMQDHDFVRMEREIEQQVEIFSKLARDIQSRMDRYPKGTQMMLQAIFAAETAVIRNIMNSLRKADD